MSRKKVEEILTIAALKRLLTLTHLVKEPILIEKIIATEYEYHLYLTENGIERRRIKPIECLLEKIPLSEIVEVYQLTHNKLDHLTKELNEQTRS